VRAVVNRDPVVAVPDAARAVFVAAVPQVSSRRPVVVAVPTAAEAERLAHDLGQFLEPADVELFPAWETLPFERVSPSLATMGRRLRVLWRLRSGQPPAVILAPVRALVQRLGPHVEDIEPVVVAKGDRVDRDELVERLVAMGYRREYQVEARGELAVRGSIVDVYPSTDDHPVRIDLWGDEVDRLSAFGVADQRSTHDVEGAAVFPTRELLPTAEVRERAAALVMLVEPRRMRDRAQELLDEEAALAGTLAVTWGAAAERELPRLSLEFDRLLEHTRAGTVSLLATPDTPETPHVAATAFDPVVGDTDALARRLRAFAGEGYSVVLAAEGAGSAGRLHDVLAGEGIDAHAGDPAAGAIRLVTAPLERGVVLPGIHLALIAEADLTGRRRVHRRARGARRGTDYYDDLEPGDYVVHYVHGVGRYL